jgi:hypothetical protein
MVVNTGTKPGDEPLSLGIIPLADGTEYTVTEDTLSYPNPGKTKGFDIIGFVETINRLNNEPVRTPDHYWEAEKRRLRKQRNEEREHRQAVDNLRKVIR